MDGHTQERSSPAHDNQLLLRFLVGAAIVGRERLLAELRTCAIPEVERSPHPQSGGRLIGALFVVPPLVAGGLRLAWRATRERASQLASPAQKVLRMSQRGRQLDDRLNRMSEQLAQVLLTLGAIGQAERAAGMALAEELSARVYADVFAQLGDSPQLQHLIQEHSAGLTRSVIDQLRDRSADADSRVEGLMQRFRRNH